MKRSKFDETRDQIAATSAGPDPRLMCSAHGCPNLWSTSDGHLCRWHAEAETGQWPRITQELQDHITDRAQAAGMQRIEPQPLRADPRRLDRALAKLRLAPYPRAWIGRLQAKVDRGEPLSAMQKHCLAQVRQAEAE